MRWKLMVLVIGITAAAMSARADDDVIVDLSVLDGLESSFAAPAQPLFPVLPADPKPAKVKKIEKKPVVKKEPLTKKEEKPALTLPAAPQPESTKAEEPEQVVVVDVEPAPQPQPKTSQPEEIQKPLEHQPAAGIPDSAEIVAKKTMPPASTPEENILPQPQVSASENVPQPQKKESLPSAAGDVSPALLIDDEQTIAPELGKIAFADGVDELTAQQKAEIDVLTSKFKNTDKNKIAIYSYNLDDGVDSFKRKRISLNRAIEIRSYLLKKGYKNFSIKVINIGTGSDKINTVELEEI